MKYTTLIILLFFICLYSCIGTSSACDRQHSSTFGLQQTDSLTITVFVSFTVNESGKVDQEEVDKTECSEYDIDQLDKEAINKLENEALRVIGEMDDLKPMDKPTKFTQPIKMKLPAGGLLKE